MHVVKSMCCTVGTLNKAKVGKQRIIPYCESFHYCESWLFAHGKSVSTEACQCLYVLLRNLLLRVPTVLYFYKETALSNQLMDFFKAQNANYIWTDRNEVSCTSIKAGLSAIALLQTLIRARQSFLFWLVPGVNEASATLRIPSTIAAAAAAAAAAAVLVTRRAKGPPPLRPWQINGRRDGGRHDDDSGSGGGSGGSHQNMLDAVHSGSARGPVQFMFEHEFRRRRQRQLLSSAAAALVAAAAAAIAVAVALVAVVRSSTAFNSFLSTSGGGSATTAAAAARRPPPAACGHAHSSTPQVRSFLSLAKVSRASSPEVQ